jgi:hypothetical protein
MSDQIRLIEDKRVPRDCRVEYVGDDYGGCHRDSRPCADAMRRTKARRIVSSLSFVQTLRSKEATKWIGRRALRFLGIPFTARWN